MGNNIKILIVEDEVVSGMLLKEELTIEGFDIVQVVSNAADAAAVFERDTPDLVLCDIGLPGNIDGIDCIKRLHEIKRVPVIYMTGYDDSETRERASVTRPLAYFIKPVNTADIVQAYYTSRSNASE